MLAASEMGEAFYGRFGFQDVGRYPTYCYSRQKLMRGPTALERLYVQSRWRISIPVHAHVWHLPVPAGTYKV